VTVHEADCTDCPDRYVSRDRGKVRTWARDHRQETDHAVEVQRAATDGGGVEFEWSRTIANGFERCVWCGIVFGAEDRDDDIRGEEHAPGIGGGLNYTHGPVRDRSGEQYESVGESPPGSYLMHVNCYLEYHAEVASETDRSLHEYATDGGTVLACPDCDDCGLTVVKRPEHDYICRGCGGRWTKDEVVEREEYDDPVIGGLAGALDDADPDADWEDIDTEGYR